LSHLLVHTIHLDHTFSTQHRTSSCCSLPWPNMPCLVITYRIPAATRFPFSISPAYSLCTWYVTRVVDWRDRQAASTNDTPQERHTCVLPASYLDRTKTGQVAHKRARPDTLQQELRLTGPYLTPCVITMSLLDNAEMLTRRLTESRRRLWRVQA